MHYNRLIAAAVVANVIVAWCGVRAGWWSRSTVDLPAIAAVAQVNFLLAVLPRQHYVINLVGWLATRPDSTWPRRVRWTLGKYYHLGGIHVGCAVAGTVWYVVYLGSSISGLVDGAPDVTAAGVALGAAVAAVFVAMIVTALPSRRARDHDRFETVHRLGAWLALGLVWANTALTAIHRQPDEPVAGALATTPVIWLLVTTTCLAMWPWMLLRKIPISVKRPSTHAAIVRLDHRITTTIGTTRAISRRPLVGWHHFAVVPPTSGCPGYRMLVSRAGDWTGSFIDDPPAHVWVRGIPATGVANVRRLFNKVVFVVTGSGIGPALSHLLADELPTKLLWITRDPCRTYGDEFLDEVRGAQPDALIWDTDCRGKPDVLTLAHHVYTDVGAEAVICISNRTLTWAIVHGLEQRGIPAFGPIWDS